MSNLYKNITSAATYAIATGPTVLHSVVVNTTAAGTAIIKDGGVAVATLQASVLPGTFLYDIAIKGALSVVTAAASDLTVCYRPN